jgi:hypothetical protein
MRVNNQAGPRARQCGVSLSWVQAGGFVASRLWACS